jgi:signal transduction histidine kinase
MEEENLESSTRGEFLGIIQSQAVQLSEMVNNLLDASKFDEGKMKLDKKPMVMLEILQQTMLRLRGFAHQQKVKLVSQLPETLPVILGDQERLGQVLTNLVGNAIKFTPAGGQVSVTASVSAGGILVEVQDTGMGVPPQAQEHIFSRYYQVGNKDEGSRKGSGLGLYIAQEIIKGHNGQIWVESNGIPGKGSIFRFILPLPETPVEL